MLSYTSGNLKELVHLKISEVRSALHAGSSKGGTLHAGHSVGKSRASFSKIDLMLICANNIDGGAVL